MRAAKLAKPTTHAAHTQQLASGGRALLTDLCSHNKTCALQIDLWKGPVSTTIAQIPTSVSHTHSGVYTRTLARPGKLLIS